MSRTRERLAPLVAWVVMSVLAACVSTLAVAAIVLHANARLSVPVWQVLAAGAPMALLIAIAAAWVAARFARALRLLRGEAMRRLHDPAAPVTGSTAAAVPDWSGSEMVELARTLDALHLRVRMADEVAERHRRSAETASAGMFELLAGLVEAEEGARGQLSAELHDTVAQSLMTARSLLAGPASGIEAASELVAEAEEQVRAVMARTRPPALRDGDLARAVAALRDDMDNRYGLAGHGRLARAALPAAAGHRGDGLPLLPGGPAQRREARGRRHARRSPCASTTSGSSRSSATTDPASTPTTCDPSGDGTSAWGCCGSGPGSSAAPSTSSRGRRTAPRSRCGCRGAPPAERSVCCRSRGTRWPDLSRASACGSVGSPASGPRRAAWAAARPRCTGARRRRRGGR